MTRRSPPRILSIAGSDSGGGAGIQADLKTFCAHGVYGMTAITAVTAQNTRSVAAVQVLGPEMVAAQIDSVLSDIGADAIKIGMLGNGEVVRSVAASLERFADRASAVPIVLDPVMVAKSGDSLLESDALETLRADLVPLATLVTPNLPEGELLLGSGVAPARPLEDRLELARELARQGPAILLKGGHAAEPDGTLTTVIEDVLCIGSEIEVFRHDRIETESTHGTGCCLSSAIAARLGSGATVREAVRGAIDYLEGALAAAYPIGATGRGGHGPPNHLFRQSPRTG